MLNHLLNQTTSWLALLLLVCNYALQGYLLHQLDKDWLLSLFIIGYVLIQFAVLLPSVQHVINMIQAWLGSDVIHIAGMLTTAFFMAVAMVWIGILENLLLIATVELLTRLELQQANLNRFQRLAVLSICLVLGLGLGWNIYKLGDQPLT